MAEQHPIAKGLHTLADLLEREKGQGGRFASLSSLSEERLQKLPLELMKKAQAMKEMQPSRAVSNQPAGGAERTEEWARTQLNQIFKEVKSCEACRSLGSLFDTVVFATGDPMADLMFVGEAPGAEEEKERKPLEGPAGQKLDGILKAMGLSREAVYLTNIVKYRPKKDDGRFQGSSDRKPSQVEMETSIGYLRREIEVVAPKVIVALGGTAAEGLLERGGSLPSMRNQIHDFSGVPVIVTEHPSQLIRQETGSDKGKASKRSAWEDMLKVMDLLGLQISEKQRGYFL